jgi:hypothetical protein
MDVSKLVCVAVNKKYQSTVNRFLAWNFKYDQLVNQELDETRKGEHAYEKAFELYHELTKREQANICKTFNEIKGCY